MTAPKLLEQAIANGVVSPILPHLQSPVLGNFRASQTQTLLLPRALAAKEGKQIFAKENLDRYEIPSAPALYSSIKALKLKGLLDEEGTGKGTVVFDDPLFAIWLRESFEA